MKRILFLALAVCVMLFAMTGCRASGNITTDRNTADGRVDRNGSEDGIIDDDDGSTTVHGDIEMGRGTTTNGGMTNGTTSGSANGGMNANGSGTGGTGSNSGNMTGSGGVGSSGSTGGTGMTPGR